MEPTIVFTLWVGSWGMKGRNDVLVGRAMPTAASACRATTLARPTFDAKYEIIDEKAEG